MYRKRNVLHLERLEQRVLLTADLGPAWESFPADLSPAGEIQPLLTVASDNPADYEVNAENGLGIRWRGSPAD